eukprot:SAG31_NODE_1781_length_7282_cov_1.770291_2_plen_112_part_00
MSCARMQLRPRVYSLRRHRSLGGRPLTQLPKRGDGEWDGCHLVRRQVDAVGDWISHALVQALHPPCAVESLFDSADAMLCNEQRGEQVTIAPRMFFWDVRTLGIFMRTQSV